MARPFDAIDAERRGYSRSDWDEVSDNPEWTAEDMAKAKPFEDTFPDLDAGVLSKDRKKPGPVRRKQPVTIRLDIDLLERLRASGTGWQSRLNDILRRHIDEAT